MSFSGTAKICLLHPFFNIAVLSFFYAAGTLVTECVGKSDYAGNVPLIRKGIGNSYVRFQNIVYSC